MRVLGIDTGLRKTGYAVVTKNQREFVLLDCGIVSTDEHKSLPFRLETIYREIQKVIDDSEPDIVVYESIFFNKNPKTFSLMAHAHGVLLLASEQKGLQIEEYTPAEIKKAITGNGTAAKSQVRYMVGKFIKEELRREPFIPIISGRVNSKLKEDISDAIACALCYLLRNSQ